MNNIQLTQEATRTGNLQLNKSMRVNGRENQLVKERDTLGALAPVQGLAIRPLWDDDFQETCIQ